MVYVLWRLAECQGAHLCWSVHAAISFHGLHPHSCRAPGTQSWLTWNGAECTPAICYPCQVLCTKQQEPLVCAPPLTHLLLGRPLSPYTALTHTLVCECVCVCVRIQGRDPRNAYLIHVRLPAHTAGTCTTLLCQPWTASSWMRSSHRRCARLCGSPWP